MFQYSSDRIINSCVLYKTTVKFKAPFEAKSGAKWFSNKAQAQVEAKIDLKALNTIDNRQGVITAITILNLAGQAEKNSKTGKLFYPTITDEAKHLIHDRVLWNYRTFMQGYNNDLLVNPKVAIAQPHDPNLCEACKEVRHYMQST
jgi:hypothetical protein